MDNIKYSTIVEDSKHNKFFFYYLNQAIYCEELSYEGTSKTTMIINQVNNNFQLTIDNNDIVYLVCSNQNKGILVITYQNNRWKFQESISIQGNSSVYLINCSIIQNSLHIIYAKRLPILNFYNIFHIFSSNNNSFSNNMWNKHSISEIFSNNLLTDLSCATSNNDSIHVAGLWHDGTNHSIIYCNYDSEKDYWHKSIVTTLSSNEVNIKLISDNVNIYLLSSIYEDDISLILCYSRKERRANVFEFSFLNKYKSKNKINPTFFIDNKRIYSCWIENNEYTEMIMREDKKGWENEKKYSINDVDNILLRKVIENTVKKGILSKDIYCSLDNDFNINKPLYVRGFENQTLETKITSTTDTPHIQENIFSKYIPQIFKELQQLTNKVNTINEKLSNNYTTSYSVHNNNKPNHSNNYENPSTVKKNPTQAIKLKKSNFIETFMKTDKLLTKPSASAIHVGEGSLPNSSNVNSVKKEDKTEYKELENIQPNTANNE